MTGAEGYADPRAGASVAYRAPSCSARAQPVADILDLMRPAGTRWRRLGERRLAGFEEFRRRRAALAGEFADPMHGSGIGIGAVGRRPKP